MERREFKADVKNVGQRVDKVISEKYEDISRMTAQRLIEEGNVLINGKNPKTSSKVNLNDTIIVNLEEPKQIEIKM